MACANQAEGIGQPQRPELGADARPCMPQLADAFQAAGKPLSLQAAQGLLHKDVLPRDRDGRMLQQGSLPMLPGVSHSHQYILSSTYQYHVIHDVIHLSRHGLAQEACAHLQ